MNRGKTIAFFDNSNIFKGSQRAGWRIDAKLLMKHLEKGGDVWQSFFFAAISDPPRFSQTNFYRILKQDLHFEMVVLPLGQRTQHCKACNDKRILFTEKGIDVALATKLLILAHNRAFETALLLSGDKDYLETVKAVKGLGLRVEIISWRESLSRDLGTESSAPIVYFDDLKSEIELKAAPDTDLDSLMASEAT